MTEDEAVGWHHRLTDISLTRCPARRGPCPSPSRQPHLPAQLGVQRQGTRSLPTVDSGPCRAVGSYQQASPRPHLDGHAGPGPGVSDPALQGPDGGASCSWPAAHPGRPSLPRSPGPDAGAGVHLSGPTLPHQRRGVVSPGLWLPGAGAWHTGGISEMPIAQTPRVPGQSSFGRAETPP